MKVGKPIPKSVLSIDLGKRRIGLAGCDPLGITVTSLPAIHRKSFEEDLKIFKKQCSVRKIQGLIIGLPVDENGRNTNQAHHCKKYAIKLAKALDLPIAMINEHSSSWAAKEIYKVKDDRSGHLDSIAAVIILDQWLKDGPEVKPVYGAAPKTSQKG